ncbi:putative metallo-hydrolase-like protein 2 [Colletotrichum chlorophyti]|uniref:Putative metallo-hydrolase-like protein 2 n=1 Tax=Colletotrichum chlorophyti TaxID=708187 RepID=A0A1Q8S2J2_9PEZI|nr:putative metallo-hydrolase-like protein 2 [Colletotrichum chlorophyti]
MAKEPIIHEIFEPVTNSWQYIVADPSTKSSVIIDPVLDFDPARSTVSTQTADALLAIVRERGYKVVRLLETHVHADHLTASKYLQSRLREEQGGFAPDICIGKRIGVVQERFAEKYGIARDELANVFDHLLDDDEVWDIGELTAKAIHLPGHTPDHMGYMIGSNVFAGDSLFNHDVGSARCDFPGGNARDLFVSVRRLLNLPQDTKIWAGHDYPPAGRGPVAMTKVSQQKAENKHLGQGVTEEDFIKWREERDAALGEPRLMHWALQVNMPYSITIKQIEGKPGKVYYPLQLNEVPKPSPGPHEVLVRITAAALNHRDLFIRRHLYPGISFDHPLFSDGYGIVVEVGRGANKDLLNKPVLITPSRGWASSPDGPEDSRKFSVIGGTKLYPDGTAQDYLSLPQDEVELAPEHLTPAEGAAVSLVGLTGWRALVTKSGNAQAGRNILVTGIGGGVALQVLQFGVALGCNIYVTSGDETKIERAKSMGAAGGVNYKKDGWEKDLQGQLPKSRPYLDAVIDGAGGDIVSKAVKILKPGGVISQYGMTVSPQMDWVMQAVLKNVELKGTTMGSREEYRDMVAFVREKKIRPVVSRTVKGLANLEGIEELFKDMEAGKQFGKLVIEFEESSSSPKL